jgi:hypothetical protein
VSSVYICMYVCMYVCMVFLCVCIDVSVRACVFLETWLYVIGCVMHLYLCACSKCNDKQDNCKDMHMQITNYRGIGL